MDSVELRLECLKLAYRKDHSPESAVAIAKVLEAYANPPAPPMVTVHPPEESKRGPGRPKKIGNPFEE